MNRKHLTLLIIGGIALVLLAFIIGRITGGGAHAETAGDAATASAEPTVWTCSMHPSIQQPDPGDCPICGMDLIPLADEGGEALGPRELTLSATARQLAQLQVQPVERRLVERQLRMVGSVTYDETRLATITAWVAGRLDRLYVDYTGIRVNEGDHMVWMYSPQILAAQEELLQAKQAAGNLGTSSQDFLRETSQATYEAARDKLRLWGLTEEQVAAIEARGTPSDHIQINAPIGGIVIHKNAMEGEYVEVGTPIYRIADLNQVWVMLDAYESDLTWLRYGQEVDFRTEAYPGEIFSGRIAFIDPVLTERTRTVKVRVSVSNEDGRLKPGMFVRAVVEARIASGGKVIDPDLVGKWIGPMHPEIVRDTPGDCPVCGMPLVPAEELGYENPEEIADDVPLVIPATAPLITGTRAVVYVQHADDPSRFAGREIVLGPRAGDFYLVTSGLAAGELVVTNGAFKLDSALQIRAKPSMMNPDEEVLATSPEPELARLSAPPAFGQQLRPLFDLYFQAQQTLAADELAGAKDAAKGLQRRLPDIDVALLEGAAHVAWMAASERLERAAGRLGGATDIGVARAAFEELSLVMTRLARQFHTGFDQELYLMHCPMAFDNRGADWLQLQAQLANPYFGASMLRCGETRETIAPTSSPEAAEPAVPSAFHQQLQPVFDAYFQIQQALAADDLTAAEESAGSLAEQLGEVDQALLADERRPGWAELAEDLSKAASGIQGAADIAWARGKFDRLSAAMIELAQRFRAGFSQELYLMHCPMAFDNVGADWLQRQEQLANPYFGASMLRCGETRETIEPAVAE